MASKQSSPSQELPIGTTFLDISKGEGGFMTRIAGAPLNQGGPIRRLFVGLVYRRTRRRLGHVIVPIQVTAHHPRILWGYAQMERSQAGAKLVDAKLKGLAELRVATLVGCPF